MPPYYKNIDENPQEYKVKITSQDLQKIDQMVDNADSVDFDALLQEGTFSLHGTSIVVIRDGDPVAFEQSDKLSVEMKDLYDYVRDFTLID